MSSSRNAFSCWMGVFTDPKNVQLSACGHFMVVFFYWVGWAVKRVYDGTLLLSIVFLLSLTTIEPNRKSRSILQLYLTVAFQWRFIFKRLHFQSNTGSAIYSTKWMSFKCIIIHLNYRALVLFLISDNYMSIKIFLF